MENSLKGYKDENIKKLIAKMESGEVPYTLKDLQAFMTEATERGFEQDYIDRIGELIKRDVLKDVVSTSDYRKNAEINYAEKFGDDEPAVEEEPVVEEVRTPEPEPEIKTEHEPEPQFAPEETKVVPVIREGDVPPIEVPSEVMRASVPEMLEVPAPEAEESSGSAEKLDVLEEVAVDDDIERLRNKTNKKKTKEERKEMKKQKKRNNNMKNNENLNSPEIPNVSNETPVVPDAVPAQREFPDDYYEFEAFPFLSFVAGLNKVLGWIFFLGIIGAGLAVSVMYFIDKVPIISGIMAGSVILGTLFLIMFYASSEKIALRLEIERHLRYLDRK